MAHVNSDGRVLTPTITSYQLELPMNTGRMNEPVLFILHNVDSVYLHNTFCLLPTLKYQGFTNYYQDFVSPSFTIYLFLSYCLSHLYFYIHYIYQLQIILELIIFVAQRLRMWTLHEKVPCSVCGRTNLGNVFRKLGHICGGHGFHSL